MSDAVKLALATADATDEASWQYWREIAKTLARAVIAQHEEIESLRVDLSSSAAYHKRVCGPMEAQRDALRAALKKAVTLATGMCDELKALEEDPSMMQAHEEAIAELRKLAD